MITAAPNTTKIQEMQIVDINARLPLIESIVGDLSRHWAEILETRATLERAEAKAREDNATYREQDHVEDVIDNLNRLVDRVNSYIREVESLGGTVQEYKRGVVTFPMRRDGRTVLASWRRGEPCVGFFHELHECFSHRKSL